jgi:hypothetical protein
MSDGPELYGLMAEFDDPVRLLDATRRAREAGYRAMDAYSPFPIEGLHEALGAPRTILPLVVLLGGLFGGAGGYALQYWVSAIAYPLNVGGRPLNSWPAFVPPTFECTVLGAALAALLGMLALNGLPCPHHAVFNVERFALATRNRFFLCIEARDLRFDADATREFLQTLEPREVSTVMET